MSATTTAADRALEEQVGDHHRRFSPLYQGHLSDHGPMAALALRALGAPAEQVADYLRDYQQRLDPLDRAPATYLAALDAFEHRVLQEGIEPVLARYLPRLISGWARHAYHPLIRLASGYQHGIPGEVAAGLAYLSWCGPEPAFDQLAALPPRRSAAAPVFAAMKACATSVSAERNFNACLSLVVEDPAFQRGFALFPDPFRSSSLEALRIFASTGDFFALHLVTGAHAFRILQPFAGPERDAILVLGLLAGYAAVGAPDYRKAIEPRPVPADWLSLAGRRDEHRIKLAWSVSSQAAFFDDRAYLDAAVAYLGRR